MSIIKITESNLKSEICNSILRKLPLWFGIESAIIKYTQDVKSMQTWVAYDNNLPIGFVSVHRHFPETAEIHVMGILQQFHRKGIGHQLISESENSLRGDGAKFLTVKTLSASRPCAEYDQTRNFYLKAGFVPLEEFKTLWDESNPCLFMVKNL